VLIDRGDPGRATDAGAGILSPETHQDPDPDTFTLGMAAARHYPEMVGRLAADGEDDPGFAVTGSLLVAERPGDDETMERAAQLIARRTPGLVEPISPDEAVGPSTARPGDGSTAGSSPPPSGGPPSPAGCGCSTPG
jgi:D-amino-acid dehydrogenase